jgi:hypothetical protein
MTTRTLAAMVADGMTASETRGRAFRVIGGDYAVGSTVELLNGATVGTTEACATVTDAGTSGVRVGEHVDIRPENLAPVGDTVTFATLVNRGETSEALRSRRFTVLPGARSRYSDPAEIAAYVGAIVESLNGSTDSDGDVYCRVTDVGSSSTSVGRTLYVSPEYLATEEDGTETRDAATLARELTAMTEARDAATRNADSLRESLNARIRAHEADIALIGSALLEEAEERGWCDVFDGVVDTLNARLNVELPTRRPSEVTLYICDEDGNNLYSVVVDSSDAYEAAGDLVRYASRNGLISDYNSE